MSYKIVMDSCGEFLEEWKDNAVFESVPLVPVSYTHLDVYKRQAYVEPALMEAKGYDSFQFVRNGFFCADIHDSKEGCLLYTSFL